MSPIVFAIISYLGWGTGDIFGIIVIRKIGAYSTTFWSLVFSFTILSFVAPFAPGSFRNFSPEVLFLNILLGLIGIGAFVAFNEGMRVGNASLVGTISASFAMVSVLLSLIFFKESINLYQSIGIIVTFLGLILSSLDFKDLKRLRIRDKGILMAFIAMIGWGVYFTFIRIPIRQVGWFWASYIIYMLFPVFYLFLRSKKIEIARPTVKGVLVPLLTAVIILRIAELSYNYAIGKGLISVIAPIAGSYPTLFVVLAFLVFKDPIKRQQVAGIITTLVGIVLLSAFSI